ncbi:MAG: hypothetical protein U0869_09805 [Chloroflexota bacterium]
MGITVLAVLAVVTGILALVSGLALLGVGGLTIKGADANGGNVLALGALTFAIAPVALGLGYGFWAMKPWAWAAGLALYCAQIGIAVFAVLLAGASLLAVIVEVGIAIFMIVYLMQPKVRSVFGR